MMLSAGVQGPAAARSMRLRLGRLSGPSALLGLAQWHWHVRSLRSRLHCASVFLKTGPAHNRYAFRWLERHGCFKPAFRAGGSGFDVHFQASLGSFSSTGSAPPGFVFELLILEEGLFICTEYKHAVKLITLQNLVGEFHGGFLYMNETPCGRYVQISCRRQNGACITSKCISGIPGKTGSGKMDKWKIICSIVLYRSNLLRKNQGSRPARFTERDRNTEGREGRRLCRQSAYTGIKSIHSHL